MSAARRALAELLARLEAERCYGPTAVEAIVPYTRAYWLQERVQQAVIEAAGKVIAEEVRAELRGLDGDGVERFDLTGAPG